MLDRRTFLKVTIATSAIAVLAVAAQAAEPLATVEGASIEPLDRLSDLHPGFAYFAGLPGHLGMPFAQRMQWATTQTAHQAFTDLQTRCGIACVVIGSSGAHDEARGLSGAVLRAHGQKIASAHDLAPYGKTIALVMPGADWQMLDERTRAAITTAAARMVRGAQLNAAPPHATVSPDSEKIAEAVVASIANHDALTQRINASYFAYRNAAAASRPKNGV